MAHPLDDDALIELGKFTWEAIELEGYVDTVCSFIRYANPRDDHRSISQKVKDAKAEMKAWPLSGSTPPVVAWLDEASEALESRNALLHGTVLARIGHDHEVVGYAIAEMPRRGRPYGERDFSADAIRDVRESLERAGKGWIEALRIADELHP